MRLLFAALFNFCLWTIAPGCRAALAQNAVNSSVRWLDPSIDCSADSYPHHVNPFNVYAQASEVLKKRRPDGVLFFSVNVVFGFCSETEKEFVPQGSRALTVIGTEKWPWQRLPFVKEVRAQERVNTSGMEYNTLEIRVAEELLSRELEAKEKVSVTVNYNDFHLRGVRVKWIFEHTPAGIKARVEGTK